MSVVVERYYDYSFGIYKLLDTVYRELHGVQLSVLSRM
jgi:hypothetical protein